MYRVHFGAKLLHTNANIAYEYQDENIPAISWTASKNENGRINLTITNTDVVHSQKVHIDIRGQETETVSYRKIITADEVNAINTFDNSEQISLENFVDYERAENKLSLTLPSKSVVVVIIE